MQVKNANNKEAHEVIVIIKSKKMTHRVIFHF